MRYFIRATEKEKRIKKRARTKSRSGLVSLDHELRYLQNVEFGLFFVLNRVEEVKSTYIVNAAQHAESVDKIDLSNLSNILS